MSSAVVTATARRKLAAKGYAMGLLQLGHSPFLLLEMSASQYLHLALEKNCMRVGVVAEGA